MLFSEPKIPQSARLRDEVAAAVSFSALQRAENSSIITAATEAATAGVRFSALQRAENSSIPRIQNGGRRDTQFQCSSASRKFLNRMPAQISRRTRKRFSALQRAENSSIELS